VTIHVPNREPLSWPLDVYSMSLAELKLMIENETSIASAAQRILFDGREISHQESNTLASLGIEHNGCSLTMIARGTHSLSLSLSMSLSLSLSLSFSLDDQAISLFMTETQTKPDTIEEIRRHEQQQAQGSLTDESLSLHLCDDPSPSHSLTLAPRPHRSNLETRGPGSSCHCSSSRIRTSTASS